MINESILRDLTNEELSKINFSGEVLDLGGGTNTRYDYILKKKNIDNLEHINIDKSRNPTYVFDLNKKIKLKKKYDYIISIHTIEHVKNFNNILNFSENLNDGGEMILITPFIFRIHSDPFDFNRPTYDFYDNYFDKSKFQVKIKPLGYGIFSTSFSLLEPLFSRFGLRIIGHLLRLFFIGLDKSFCAISKSFKKYYSVKNYPLGYIVKIKRIK